MEQKIQEIKKIKDKIKSKKKYYFTQDTENAIIDYNEQTKIINDIMEKTTDFEQLEEPYKEKLLEAKNKKNDIFVKSIEYPLNKMAENLIHTFKFHYFDVPPERVKKDVVAHVATKLDKFNPERGFKAFSYFSIVAKNWLIHHNNTNFERRKNHRSIDFILENDKDINVNELLYSLDKKNNREVITSDLQKVIHLLSEHIETNLETLFIKKRDKKIALATIDILNNYNSIEYYHKKALYLLIRENCGEKQHYITRVMNIIKECYFSVIRKYYNEKYEKNKWQIYNKY